MSVHTLLVYGRGRGEGATGAQKERKKKHGVCAGWSQSLTQQGTKRWFAYNSSRLVTSEARLPYAKEARVGATGRFPHPADFFLLSLIDLVLRRQAHDDVLVSSSQSQAVAQIGT